MFYTAYQKPTRKQQDFSNQYQQTYRIERDKKTGTRKIVEDTKINIYDKIQEGFEEVKIKNQIQKYDINTQERLKVDKEKIIDLTEVPENLCESMNIIANAKSIFERQSKEVKKMFNNDWQEFIAASEDGRLKNLIKQYTEPKTITQPITQTVTQPITQTTTQQITQPAVVNGVITGQQEIGGINLND